jgi:ferric-dicitrate binding protein FerR (iron transport regulator)
MSNKIDKEFYRLLAKKMAGEISPSEDDFLNTMIQSSEDARRAAYNAHQIWSANIFDEQDSELISQKEAREKIWYTSFDKEKSTYSKRSMPGFLRYAAALFILISAIFTVFFLREEAKPVNPEVSIIHKHTSPGQKSSITLRDGTIVWLNSGSSITYWSDYNENIRLIKLEGQAFFEVFKDHSKPFLVKCGDLKIKALGTSFDVNGYSGAPIQVSLLSGSVQLTVPWHEQEPDKLILKPGEYSVIGENNEIVEKGNFDSYEVMAWKEGRIIFDNATVDEILPRLELWYGVQINNQLTFNKKKPFSGTFEKENLENVLESIKTVLQFEVEINDDEITIKN